MNRGILFLILVVQLVAVSCNKDEASMKAKNSSGDKATEQQSGSEQACAGVKAELVGAMETQGRVSAELEASTLKIEALEEQVASSGEKLSQLQKNLHNCEEAREKAEENAENSSKVSAKMRESITKCEKSAETLQSKVGELEGVLETRDKEIADLKATPVQRILELSKKFESVGSVAEAVNLGTAVEAFLVAHGRTPQAREARKLKKNLSGELKKLRKAEAERKAQEAIADIREQLKGISDGDLSLPHLVIMSEYLESNGLDFDSISRMPKADHREASKDPGSVRGNAMVVRGKVIQIQKDGKYFRGLIGMGGYFGTDRIYNFVTPGTTKGVFEKKKAKFAGIFSQLYEYKTRGGGSNQAFVLVGYFDKQ